MHKLTATLSKLVATSKTNVNQYQEWIYICSTYSVASLLHR